MCVVPVILITGSLAFYLFGSFSGPGFRYFLGVLCLLSLGTFAMIYYFFHRRF